MVEQIVRIGFAVIGDFRERAEFRVEIIGGVARCVVNVIAHRDHLLNAPHSEKSPN